MPIVKTFKASQYLEDFEEDDLSPLFPSSDDSNISEENEIIVEEKKDSNISFYDKWWTFFRPKFS